MYVCICIYIYIYVCVCCEELCPQVGLVLINMVRYIYVLKFPVVVGSLAAKAPLAIALLVSGSVTSGAALGAGVATAATASQEKVLNTS